MTVSSESLFDLLWSLNIRFFTGVPDSTLKDFTAFLDKRVDSDKHVVTANEGNSIGLATGYHLATGRTSLVYMQNSGFGNSINPLLSLADPAVYSIPMIVMVGWRGEPGAADEPQHKKQGEVQIKLIESLQIPYCVVSRESFEPHKIKKLVSLSIEKSRPCIILVKKGTFTKMPSSTFQEENGFKSREEALDLLLSNLDEEDILVSTTGKTSREIFEIREKKGQSHQSDFLMVGSMGHCSSISLGVALNAKNRNVFCVDGDGSFIMHMGSLSTIGKLASKNFKHIVLNNFCHESVGLHRTAADSIEITKIALANNYTYGIRINSREELINAVDDFKSREGPCLMELIVGVDTRKDLGRPTITPKENKNSFMEFLRNK